MHFVIYLCWTSEEHPEPGSPILRHGICLMNSRCRMFNGGGLVVDGADALLGRRSEPEVVALRRPVCDAEPEAEFASGGESPLDEVAEPEAGPEVDHYSKGSLGSRSSPSR